VQNTPVDVARVAPPLEPLLAHAHLVLLTFGRWDDVLREPEPPSDLQVATALTQYARGVVHAARGETAQARAALDRVHAAIDAPSDPVQRAVLQIAHHALDGEIAQRSGDLRGAEAHFRQAMAIEDELLYMEPPHWYYPIRHSLGAVLLAQSRPADAETVYRQDLKRFPDNVWALTGLRLSLEAQGRAGDAAALGERIARLRADTNPPSSRL
jgi:tetratricopeptide (TPR) repeat protein